MEEKDDTTSLSFVVFSLLNKAPRVEEPPHVEFLPKAKYYINPMIQVTANADTIGKTLGDQIRSFTSDFKVNK